MDNVAIIGLCIGLSVKSSVTMTHMKTMEAKGLFSI